jgi:pimeloyl-ACP methyl ester carboxylesterase
MAEHESCFYLSADGLRLFYRDYRTVSAATPVLCIPGLTRNARDFDVIAAHLARKRRVLVTDLRGRGRSAYDPDWRHYVVPVEVGDMLRLLEAAGAPQVIVLGTSRGGIVAMAMAAVQKAAVKAVILNDVGAEIEARGLGRILEFIGREIPFASWDEAAAALKRTYASMFPNVPDARWSEFAHAIYREAGGTIVPDYDPKLGDAMREADGSGRAQGANANLWPLFAALKEIPTLVLRGDNSDLLSAATVAKMSEAKPDLASQTVKDRGHVPFLDEPEAVAAIDAFLETIP